MAYTVEDLLSVLHPHCPIKVDALCKNRRRVEHGLTTVGLKIHCLGDNRELLNLIEALGGRSEVIANRFYAHARASVTVILPPVGSARSAILLLECIEKYFGHPIFHNPRYQIQVCSPCRLDGPRAAILAIAFYLGFRRPQALQPRRPDDDFFGGHARPPQASRTPHRPL